MSPIESGEKSPEINVKQLEEKLLRGIKLLKEKKPDCTHKDIKDLVRFFLMKEAESLGISREEALSMAPYFMRLTYEDHKEADKMWEHLGSLSARSKNPLAATQISTEILETTTGGITPMWHLLEKIIKGELTVEQKEAVGGKIYSIESRPNTGEGNQIADSVEEKFKDLIKPRPPLNIDEDVLKMSKQDGDLFLKIPRFMQEDSDAIVNSETWHPIIEEYFKGVAQHLISTLRRLNVESSKSNARKTRFKKFIGYIFESYLKQLMEYCKSLAADGNQRNQFASDLMFEHYLASNNLLTQNNKEPEYKVIEERWKSLFMEIKRHVQDEATLYMKALDTGPVGQVQPVEQVQTVTQNVRRQTSSEINRTIMGIPTLDLPVTPTKSVVGLGKPGQEGERRKLETADTIMTRAISEEFGKFPTQPIKLQDEKDNRLQSSAMLSYPYIAVVPGSQAEQELLNLVNRDVDNLFVQNEEKLKSTGECENFIWQLKKIAKTRLSTQGLMSAFFSRVIARYEDLVKKCNEQEKNNVFDNVSGVFNAIGQGSEMPNTITKNLKGENDLKMDIPKASNLDSILTGIPSIESGEFGNLKEFLVKKGLYEKFLQIESDLKEKLLGNDVKDFGVFTELNKRLSIAVSDEEAFVYYYKGKKEVIDAALKKIKGLTGNWFTKHFKFGRSEQVKEEMERYATQLRESICATWDEALKPTIKQYGKIIFGADLYVQKS
ncbi:hypothetical protein C0416_05395 [bacterium]|nr:hypothetical protein [bacterium]